MTDFIQRLAQDALDMKDKFIRQTDEKNFPPIRPASETDRTDPEKIGNALAEFIMRAPVKAYPEEKLFGRFKWSGCGYTSELYTRGGHDAYNTYWNQCCFSHPRPLFYWGWTHIVLDFEYILTHGIEGYAAEIEKKLEKLSESESEKASFYKAMLSVLHAIKAMNERYAEECGNVTFCGEKLSDVLKKVPVHPAETFYEAVQSVWTMFQFVPDSLGRIDQYLYPYYVKETQEGTLTREAARELLEELFVKVYETQIDNTSLPISGHNHLVVGGYTIDGKDGYNELSALILECIAELPTFRPQASFRYTKYTSAETMRFVTELNAKCQWIVFVNDEPRLEGMKNLGIAPADAANYTVVGCNEWCLPCGAKIDLAHVNLLHSLEDLIYNDDRFLSAKTFEEMFGYWREHLEKDMLAIVDEYGEYAKNVAKDVNIFNSAVCLPCIESGKSFTDRGTKYYGLTMSFNCISNLADSLSVIKQFVFDEKRYSLEMMLTMLKNDYRGYEAEREYILKKGRFFGNDDDYVDKIACDTVDMIYAIAKTMKREYINVLVVGSFVGATHPNIVFGKFTKATPDGRRTGDAFTMGISQSEGKDHSGLTALLNSIAKLDYRKFCGCIVSNIKMEKSMAGGADKLRKLAAMYQAFLQKGGMQLQINYLSQKELLEAQKNPEKYRNLVVRVTGYSGYFTRFDTDLQNDIIRRTVEK